jgi:hypothetical protein
MVQIVGNLEWELLKNVEIRKSIYARITNTRFVNLDVYVSAHPSIRPNGFQI